jgi:outer membrane protein assembly factor BamB
MRKITVSLLAVAFGIASFACHPRRPNLAPRPEALGFPLMEESALPLGGTANGPVRVRYGVAYFTTQEGSLCSVDVRSRRVLWTFKADGPVAAAPELGEDTVIVRDEGNTIYAVDADGRVILKTTPAESVTTPVREFGGKIFFGCGSGRLTALDPRNNGLTLWEFEAGAPVRAGPVLAGSLVVFGAEDGRLLALDSSGKLVWTFAAKGAIRVDPVAFDDSLYFGTADRYFFRLSAATGNKKWAFRLAGAPLHAAAVCGKRLVLAASDSVVYCLAARGGEILWWQPVPSRVLHAPVVADGVVLVSAESPDLDGFDLKGGYRVGRYQAAGNLLAEPEWVSPYLFVIEPDQASTGQRAVFLKRDRRPVQILGETNPVRR